MGNCNFKADKDKDSVNGIAQQFLLIGTYYSHNQELVLVLICNRKRRIWKSVESREKKGKRNICNERNVESKGNG
jgi:hypothetical protein